MKLKNRKFYLKYYQNKNSKGYYDKMLKKVKEIFSLYNLLPVAIFMFLITAIVNPSFLTSFSVLHYFRI